MTTRVSIKNEGPGRLILSALELMSDGTRSRVQLQMIVPGETEEFRYVWHGTSLIIEEETPQERA